MSAVVAAHVSLCIGRLNRIQSTKFTQQFFGSLYDTEPGELTMPPRLFQSKEAACFEWKSGDASHVEIVKLMNTKLPPVHPGEVLLEDFMKPLKLSAYRVAKDIGVSPIAITQLTKGRRSLSTQNALLLAKYLGTGAEVWIRLQAQYDLEVTREKIHARLEKIALAPKTLASGASKKASQK